MTRDDIQCLLNRIPELNDFGIGVYEQRYKSQEEIAIELAEGRSELLDSADACLRVCTWLSQIEPTDKINNSHSSYGLKHIAERDIGYVTNGVFIAAAVHCGYRYRIDQDDPNVPFAMSEKSIEAVMRRQDAEGKSNWCLPEKGRVRGRRHCDLIGRGFAFVSTTPVIYGLRDPRDTYFRYVGQTINAEERLRQHLDLTHLHGNLRLAVWKEDLHRNKLELKLEILQECATFAAADAAEREWIRRLKAEGHPLLNIADGGARVRSSSKMRQTDKWEWIELGYQIKSARETMMHSYCTLTRMLPLQSKEVRLLDSALKEVERAMFYLDDRLFREYPEWKEFLHVFYGPADRHVTDFRESLSPDPIHESPSKL